ncbi:response regulator [Flavobacterium cellulosilyticum]|uniref:histidine kinase n=2 Tax=Flavobacterium cellulosilyticum TaxID=2541731 RepID=A0A4R5CFE0_9FLAO|nr:response regulator [Flavobacterium cellulosilyticum]
MDNSVQIFKGYQTGAVDYMIKPLSPEILKAKVAVFVDLHKKNQELLVQKEKLKALYSDVKTQKSLSDYSLSLIEASHDPLFAISPEGKITDINNASIKVTGLSRQNLIGTNFFDYFTEPEKASKVYQDVFANGFVANSPLTIRHNEGKQTQVLFNGSVYKDDRENVLGVVIVARDVTAQKRFENELIEAKTKAEKASKIAENAVKAKQQFLSNMSHEIRTPMNAIIGFTKVALKTELTRNQKEYLNAIKVSGDALIVLINDILDLAKVDAGKMVFEQIPFKLSASISAMLHVFETKIKEKNIELVTEYDDSIPKVVLGDPVRLHQIILNLVSNAIKFTSKGKITVSIRLLHHNEENATVEFAITDTGIGIEENKIDTIFDDFQQATSGTSRLYGGTGLGLAIVKQLVEPQGGTITVTSKINEGSTFSFVLSFPKTNAVTETDIAISELDNKNKGIKVLVVEDIPLNQLLMETLLDDFGFERDIAENGEIAIEKLKKETYDVILMDLQMPVMNGLDATKYIRNTMHLKTPIIALTADVTTVDLAKCKDVGMNDYIAKPVDERILYSKIVSLAKKTKRIKSSNTDAMDKNRNDSEKCINLDYLKSRTKSNPKLITEMIALYLEQTQPIVTTIKQSLEDKNWTLLSAAVHKIIPSFTIMGINSKYENMARSIQECSNEEQFTEEITTMVIQVVSICTQACEELKIELNLLKNT